MIRFKRLHAFEGDLNFLRNNTWTIKFNNNNVLSCSVMSDSLRPQLNVDRQAPLSMGFPRQEYLECVAISSSRESSQTRH